MFGGRVMCPGQISEIKMNVDMSHHFTKNHSPYKKEMTVSPLP